MTENEFVNYFREIATQLKAIDHEPSSERIRFARMEEVLNRVRADLMFEPGMVIKNESGTVSGLGSNNLLEYHQCAFMILRKCDNEDYAAYQAAFEECFTIGRKILAKMLQDKRANVGIMRALDLKSTNWQKIGPVYENCYGYEFMFSLNQKAGCDYLYNENDWKPL